MKKAIVIAKVTFLQIIRQPIFGILLLVAIGIITISPSITAFALGEDNNKMLQDLGLSTILVSGLLLSAFSASGAISSEIEDQTILTIVSKPIGRLTFITGKFIGVILSLTLAITFETLVLLLVLRHGVMWAAYLERDIPVIVFGLSAAGITFFLAGLFNYLFDWKFGPTAMAIGLPLMSLAVIGAGFFDKHWKLQTFGKGYSIDIIYACILLLFAIWILAGICLVCSTRLSVVWSLIIGLIFLSVGMVIDHYVWPNIESATSTMEKVIWSILYMCVPTFQVFWTLDALDAGKSIPPIYLVYALGYGICYLIALLAISYALFLERQVGSAYKF